MLPQGFTRVAYIESTGTQYINTLFKANQSTRIVVDAQVTSLDNATSLGVALCSAVGGGYYYTLFVTEAGAVSSRFATFAIKNFSVGAPEWDVRQIYDKDRETTTVSGYSVTSSYTTFQLDYPLFIFARNNSGSADSFCKMKLYGLQIYEYNSLRHDYITCIDPNGEVGLYDDVSGEFSGNAGTGVFTAGPSMSEQAAQTLLLLHGDEIADASAYHHTLTNGGAAVSTEQSKFGGSSLYFDGSAHLAIDAINILPADSDFTVDWWEYRTTSAEGSVVFHQPVKAKDGTGTIFGYGYQGDVNVYMGNVSGSFNIAGQTSMGAEVLNAWSHRAVVRSGSTFYLFADGVLQNTFTSTESLAHKATPYIGRYDSGNYLYYQGYIDEFRISDVARWTSNFTPPTSEYNPFENIPDAPESLAYTQTGNTIALTWSASSGAESYRVYRDYAMIAEVTDTAYTDTITDAPCAHVYAVTAVNEFGESDFSGPVRVEYWGDTAPDLIYDRTPADIEKAVVLINKRLSGQNLTEDEQELWDRGLRGCYNTSDVNRVEYHTRELQSILNANGYNIHIDTQLWAKPDIMRYSDIIRYLGNIETILDAFGRSANAPELPSIDRWIDYIAANDIEKILYVTRELIYGALAMFRRAGTFTAGNDYVTQVIRRA